MNTIWKQILDDFKRIGYEPVYYTEYGLELKNEEMKTLISITSMGDEILEKVYYKLDENQRRTRVPSPLFYNEFLLAIRVLEYWNIPIHAEKDTRVDDVWWPIEVPEDEKIIKNKGPR